MEYREDQILKTISHFAGMLFLWCTYLLLAASQKKLDLVTVLRWKCVFVVFWFFAHL